MRRDDESVSPFNGKMFPITCDEVAGAGRLGAFQEDIVVGISAGMHLVGRFDPNTRVPNGSKRICDFAIASLEAGPADHLFVLGIDFPAYAQPSGWARDVQ